MLWLLAGTAILTTLLLGLRAFERASAAAIVRLLKWTAAFAGIALTLLFFLSGYGARALSGLLLAAPLLWRGWRLYGPHLRHFASQSGPGSTAGAGTPPPRSGGAMSRDEAYEVLGLRPGADAAAIHAAHRRLMRAAHPDAGGSDWLASRVNQARDVLLR